MVGNHARLWGAKVTERCLMSVQLMSVQLQARLNRSIDLVGEPDQKASGETMQRDLVHTIEGDVEHPRQLAFHHQAAAGEVAHEAADAAVVAEGNQGTVIPIAEG